MSSGNGQFNDQDHISTLIRELYDELMYKRFELMRIRRDKKMPKKEKNELVEEKESMLNGLQDDFKVIVSTHSMMVKYQKTTGASMISQSQELINMIQEIKSNMGSIVASVPTN